MAPQNRHFHEAVAPIVGFCLGFVRKRGIFCEEDRKITLEGL